MYSNIPLDLNEFMDIEVHQWLQICILDTCHWVCQGQRSLLLAGSLFQFPRCHGIQQELSRAIVIQQVVAYIRCLVVVDIVVLQNHAIVGLCQINLKIETWIEWAFISIVILVYLLLDSLLLSRLCSINSTHKIEILFTLIICII